MYFLRLHLFVTIEDSGTASNRVLNTQALTFNCAFLRLVDQQTNLWPFVAP